MNIKETKEEIRVVFQNTTEIMDLIETHPYKNPHSQEPRGSFCPYSWPETKSAFVSGWKESEGMKVSAEIMDLIEAHPSYGIQYGVTGDYIDMGACLAGVPECWGQVVEEPKAMKKVRVFVNAAISSIVDSRTIENRGAAIMALIDSLRDNGFFVEITLGFRSENVPYLEKIVDIRITFLTDNGYSRDALAFCVGHPGMMRRIIFGIREILANKPDLRGYGHSINSKPSGYDIVFEVLHKEMEKWRSIKSSQQTIAGIIERLKGGE